MKKYLVLVILGFVIIPIIGSFKESNEQSIETAAGIEENMNNEESEEVINIEYEEVIDELKWENKKLSYKIIRLEDEITALMSTIWDVDLAIIEDATHEIELYSLCQTLDEAKLFFSENISAPGDDYGDTIFFANSMGSESMMTWIPMGIEHFRSFSKEEGKIILNYIMIDESNEYSSEYSFVMINEDGWKIDEIR
ncbi:hypothetical protein [Bacillus alkalicellulosilyticus]|uniref:hypothetical protein n=1 Tax=Alkalihalobacterium alkalicellulosilyticum TaxID=1912214 RepID=UPI000997BC3F|nr:hypothetical protein [Bacillus alkalicellulosilyticus]